MHLNTKAMVSVLVIILACFFVVSLFMQHGAGLRALMVDDSKAEGTRWIYNINDHFRLSYRKFGDVFDAILFMSPFYLILGFDRVQWSNDAVRELESRKYWSIGLVVTAILLLICVAILDVSFP